MSPNETRKPGSIAARQRGPGPARYALPSTVGHANHDGTKHRLPAFSMGVKLRDKEHFSSPGPVYYIEPQYNHKGKPGIPAFTMAPRHDDKDMKDFCNRAPAPGVYSPEKHPPPGKPKAPAYPLSGRMSYKAKESGPAPNAYDLPRNIGPKVPDKEAAPAYSMLGKSNLDGFAADLAMSPGPARYDMADASKYKTKSPQYSLCGRNFPPAGSVTGPGPGAYYPEMTSATNRTPPAYTMGVKHTEFMMPLILPADDL